MFKSFINPQKIIGNGTKAATPEAFSNFISGGKTELGSSVSNVTANNISNFSRSQVEPANNLNITPLITNISTSIVNNVDNSVNNVINSFKSEVQSIIGGVQSNLSAAIQNFSKDYQQRIQNKEDNKPSNILKGFLGLYQNAINFVTFFGDSKNSKKIENSLKSLRNMFNDSFNTALIIRQTIVKIVKQLSNLPTASGTSGGLNLDVKVPGGPLKQAGRSTIGKFVKGGAGRLVGVGAVGAGAVGLGMMGMQAAKASQEEKLAETAKKGVGEEANGFMEGLNNIIERFSDAIDSLLGGKKKPSGGGGGASSGGGGGSPGGGGGGAPGGGDIQSSGKVGTPEQQALLKSISFAEGTTKSYGTIFGGKNVPELEKGELTVKEVYDMMNSGTLKGRNVGYSPGSRATGRYQFMPDTLSDIVKSGDIKWGEKFTPEAQDRAILSRMSNFRGVTPELLKKEGLSANVSNKLAPEFASFPTTSGSSFYGQPVKKLKDLQNVYGQNLNTQTPSTATPQAAKTPPSTVKPAPPSTSKVEPAKPTPEAQKVSQAVTTAPGQDSSKDVQVASLAPDITVIPGGGSQDGGAVASLPSPSMDTSDVSMYGESGNPNNPYWVLPYTLGMLTA